MTPQDTTTALDPGPPGEAEAHASAETDGAPAGGRSEADASLVDPNAPDPSDPDAPAGDDAKPLKGRVIRSGLWTVFGTGYNMVLRFGGNLILTRLLFPEAFGIMLLVNVIVLGLTMFSDVGIGPSIIQSKRGDDPKFLRTAWTVQLIRGLVLYTLALLLTWPVAVLLFGQPALLQLLPVAALAAVLDGAATTRIYTAQRNLSLRHLTVVEVVSYTLGLVVMVALAYATRSVWALVFGTLVHRASRTLLSHLVLPGARDGLAWDKPSLSELFSFGKWIFLSTSVTFLAMQGDKLMLGSLGLPLLLLGNYGIAFFLSESLSELARKVAFQALFPLFGRVYNQTPERLGSVYYRVRLRLDFAGLVACGVLIMVGDHIIALLYDDRYLAAGLFLQLLGFRVALSCTLPPTTVCLLSMGQSRTLFIANACRAVALFTLVPLGYWFGGEYLVGVVAEHGYEPYPGAVAAGADVVSAAKAQAAAGKYDLAMARMLGVVGGVVLAELAQAPALYGAMAKRGLIRWGREASSLGFLALGLGVGWAIARTWDLIAA